MKTTNGYRLLPNHQSLFLYPELITQNWLLPSIVFLAPSIYAVHIIRSALTRPSMQFTRRVTACFQRIMACKWKAAGYLRLPGQRNHRLARRAFSKCGHPTPTMMPKVFFPLGGEGELTRFFSYYSQHYSEKIRPLTTTSTFREANLAFENLKRDIAVCADTLFEVETDLP